jgi:hypothetical protein
MGTCKMQDCADYNIHTHSHTYTLTHTYTHKYTHKYTHIHSIWVS